MPRAAVCLAAVFVLALALLATVAPDARAGTGRGARSATHATPHATTGARVTPSAQPSRGPLPPPGASAPASSPLGAIGLIERQRTLRDWSARSADAFAKLAAYLDDRDSAVQARALLAYARIGDAHADPAVVRVLTDAHRPDTVRAVAAFALGAIGSPESVATLAGATRGTPPAVAAAAAEALGRIGGSRAVDVLASLLSDRDPGVRAQAAVGLGQAALSPAPDLDFAHRQNVASTLAAAIFTERDPEVRWREAWALARGYFQNAAPTLRRLLSDDQELVRANAVAGLRRLKDRSYALPIRLLAGDPSWRVRWEVHYALAALRDPTKVDLRPQPVPSADLDEPQPIASSAPPGDHPQVAIVTNRGTIVLELFPDLAPYSVDSFLYLVDRGFYNGLTYFRVISDFVVQGGDPKNTGDGGPGYSIPAELNPVQQLTGIISYGLDYDPKTNKPLLDTAGSQYYITQSPQLHLDRAFTVFGRVVRGMAVVDAIADQPDQRPPGLGPPDVAKQVYRCVPVTQQTDDVERKLRTVEIGYDAR